MATTGSEKQERKIGEFAKVAKQIFPDINELSIRGAFRYGARAALERSQFSNWVEIAEQPAVVRRDFFNLLLQKARTHLENIVGEEKVDDLIERIKVENEKYLNN